MTTHETPHLLLDDLERAISYRYPHNTGCLQCRQARLAFARFLSEMEYDIGFKA